MLHYTDGGLKNIWIANGYEIRKTSHGKAIAIHDIDGLTQAICSALTKKNNPLTGKEFRYIRSAGLLMSQDGIGKIIGADAQSVARWEKHGRLPKWADKLIRLVYLESKGCNAEIKATISRIITVERLVNQKIVISEKPKGGWQSSFVSDEESIEA
jgi:DNA-binding transcriptional regulator YiaG